MRYAPWAVDFRRRDCLGSQWTTSSFATASEAYAFIAAHARNYELRLLFFEHPGDPFPLPVYLVDDSDVVTVDHGDEQPPEYFELRDVEFPDEDSRAECYADLRHTGVHSTGGGASPSLVITLKNPRVAG